MFKIATELVTVRVISATFKLNENVTAATAATSSTTATATTTTTFGFV